jgi:hypothetical protein
MIVLCWTCSIPRVAPREGPISSKTRPHTHHLESTHPITEDPGYYLASEPPQTWRIPRRSLPPFGSEISQVLAVPIESYSLFLHYTDQQPYCDMHVQSHVSSKRECRLRYTMDRRHIERNRFAPSSPRTNTACVRCQLHTSAASASANRWIGPGLCATSTNTSPKKNVISQYLRSDRCLSVLNDCAQSHQP